MGAQSLYEVLPNPFPLRHIVTLEEGVDCCGVKARLGLLQDAEAGVIVSVLHNFVGSVCICSLSVEADAAGVRKVRTQLYIYPAAEQLPIPSPCSILILAMQSA